MDAAVQLPVLMDPCVATLMTAPVNQVPKRHQDALETLQLATQATRSSPP